MRTCSVYAWTDYGNHSEVRHHTICQVGGYCNMLLSSTPAHLEKNQAVERKATRQSINIEEIIYIHIESIILQQTEFCFNFATASFATHRITFFVQHCISFISKTMKRKWSHIQKNKKNSEHLVNNFRIVFIIFHIVDLVPFCRSVVQSRTLLKTRQHWAVREETTMNSLQSD